MMKLHSQMCNPLMIRVWEELKHAKSSPFPNECDSIWCPFFFFLIKKSELQFLNTSIFPFCHAKLPISIDQVYLSAWAASLSAMHCSIQKKFPTSALQKTELHDVAPPVSATSRIPAAFAMTQLWWLFLQLSQRHPANHVNSKLCNCVKEKKRKPIHFKYHWHLI